MRRALLAAGVAAALVAWSLALRASSWRLPLNSDEGEYSYAARVWAEGGLPYRDASTQKPPMILLLYRAGLALGGPERGPRALGILACLLTAAMLSAAAPRGWPAAARAAPAAAFVALCALPVGDYGLPANTETLVCLFTAGAALAALRRKPLAAGLLCGAAVMSKQTALYSAAALGFAAVWTGPRRVSASAAARFAAGFLALPAAWLAYFAARGGLSAFLEDAYRGNASYVAVVGAQGLAQQAGWLARWLGPKLLAGFWPALAAALFGLASLRARFSERDAVTAVLWLGGAAAGVMTGLFFFPHYFLQLAAPLSFCAAWGVARLPRGRAAAAAALAVLPALPFAPLYLERDPSALARSLLSPNPLVEAKALGLRLRALTRPEDTIYVFGSEPEIYVYAQRRAATPNSFAYMLTLRRPPPGAVDEELARLRRERPAYVVYSRQPLSTLIAHREGLRLRDEVRRWLREDYALVDETRVGDSARPAAAGEAPDFGPADSLLLFKRRAPAG